MKTESVSDFFENTNISFALLTETWTTHDNEPKIREEFEKQRGLSIIMKSRGTRGGGVAVVYRDNFAFKRHEFFTANFEILAVQGKLPNTRRQMYIFCLYYPPCMKPDHVKAMNELICEEIVKIKIAHADPLIVIAGDMNKKDCSCFERDNPEVKLIVTPPTRKDATLDLCYTNANVIGSKLMIPLWSAEGMDSDHRVVEYKFIYQGAKHTYQKITRRKFSRMAEGGFCDEVNALDWEFIRGMRGVDEKVESFHKAVESLKDKWFPLVTSKIRSDEDPWISDAIRKLIIVRDKEFRRTGRGKKWRDLKCLVRKRIAESREAYYERETEKICGSHDKKALAYTALKNLQCPGKKESWNICNMEPEKDEKDVVEELATFFNKITEDYAPVRWEKVQKTYDRPTYDLTPEMIEKRIRESKKPNSTVEGDFPPRLVNNVAKKISVPLCDIFNCIPVEGNWPAPWKREFQTVIPKTKNPKDYAELRNLSCTNFLSKVLESFVLDSIKSETSFSQMQYGGIKGSGTDNVLIEMWNNILEPLDEQGLAVGLMSVDFSKAFNRLDHQACLQKLVEKNVSNQTLRMVFAFLSERTMCVRSGNTLSSKRRIKGGSPQGTKLGNFLFCLAIDDINVPSRQEINSSNEKSPDTAIPDEYLPIITSTPVVSVADDSWNPNPYGLWRKKNVINDTIPYEMLSNSKYQEKETWETGYIDDLNVGETLEITSGISHISTAKEEKEIRALGCESMYETIKTNGRKVGMQINAKKTQLICFNPSKTLNVTCCISVDGCKVVSRKEMKILGFVFGSTLSVMNNVQNTVKKFNAALWGLFHLIRAKLKTEVLLRVYLSMLRPILDYSSNVIHTMITQEGNDMIEACQRKAMKMIFGFDKHYADLLEEQKIPYMRVRRQKLFENFCIKMSQSEKFSNRWLPKLYIEEEMMRLRRQKQYVEFHARTERLYNSPLYAMRRFLNSVSRRD